MAYPGPSPVTAASVIDTLMQAANQAAALTAIGAAPAAGVATIVTVGTITAGTWQGTAIADTYIASAATWNAKLSGNQTITISGDGSGSGATAITLTVTKLNGTTLSGLATGILKNTTGTGVPTIATAGTDYVAPAALSSYATLASPALTGIPTAPTATVGTNTTQLATTAFVLANAGSGGGAISSVVAESSSFTVTTSQSGTLFACTTDSSNTFTATLPSASDAGDGFLVWFQITSASGNRGVSTSPATQSIYQQGQVMMVWSDGLNWNSSVSLPQTSDGGLNIWDSSESYQSNRINIKPSNGTITDDSGVGIFLNFGGQLAPASGDGGISLGFQTRRFNNGFFSGFVSLGTFTASALTSITPPSGTFPNAIITDSSVQALSILAGTTPTGSGANSVFVWWNGSAWVTLGSTVFEVTEMDMALGGDATGDMYYLNSSGQLARLGIGSGFNTLVVGAGSIPAWGTLAGSVVATGNTATTGTQTSVVTFTTANDGNSRTYSVSAYANITAVSAGTLTATITFTDENGTSRTITLYPMGLTSSGLTATGFTAFAVATIRAQANTTAALNYIFTGVSIAYDAGGAISQLTP